MPAKNLEDLSASLSFDRQKILSVLSDKKWFRNTDFETQKELMFLPKEFDGFLKDLSERSGDFGTTEVLKLINISRGNYFVIPVFEVRSNQTNQIFTYEYTTPREGKDPGFRGILLLTVDNVIKYFVLKKTLKFAPGRLVYDTIGGFIQFDQNKLLNLPTKIENEIKRELGLKEIKVEKFIELGQVNADVSLTNKHNSLFAAVIDAGDSEKIRALEGKTLKTKKIGFSLVVEPIEKLAQYVDEVDDSYFLACVIRLVAKGVVKV